MKSLIILIILLGIQACGLADRKKPSQQTASMPGQPDWATEPANACIKIKELCAVGAGSGRMMAEAHARKNLAQYFSTHVQTTTNTSQNFKQQLKQDGSITGELAEAVDTQIKEVTDQVLNGVFVKKTFTGKDKVYVLMALDKRKASQIIEDEINLYDEQIRVLKNRNRRSLFRKLYRLYSKRQGLHSRYEFISGQKIVSPITLEEIYTLRGKQGEGPRVFLKLMAKKGKKDLQAVVEKALSDNNYRIVKTETVALPYQVVGQLTYEQLYLKVKGFEKYKFQFNLSALNASRESIGFVGIAITKVGRDFIHAYGKALKDLKWQLDEKIDDLNID